MTHHHKTPVREAMTSSPQTVEPSATVVEAARMMRDGDFGPVPIVEDGTLQGVLTDRDITIRVVAEGKDPQSTKVSEIASRELVTIDPEQTLEEASRLMAQHQVRRLPVCEEDGKLIGIIAQGDLALEAPDETTGEVVEEISK